MVELLSPAGNFDSLKQAVRSGANAVYFGAKNFNARAKAQNFGADLLGAVKFCHMYGAKAYLTLNTLIENQDINDLLQVVKDAINCGIDAFIVQDFGVVNLLKNCFKNIEIHASTQMAVNNYFGALEAQKMGIKRVVLSRECSLNDIKLIKQNTNLQIEYFIQGALCVCFSGNCYLSSKLFSKSGNKGECLQPCRLKYKAIIKGKEFKDGYLLSAKDICMANRLKDLIDAGVDSFKIEGRLRREEYVAGITQVYRNIIDNNFNVTKNDIQNIKKLFNRGDFTEGYLNGNGGIIDYNIQGHKGVIIGKVIEFNQGKKFNIVKIKSAHKIAKGDVIKFIYNNKENAIITAMDIKEVGDIYSITTTALVKVGANAHLIVDSVYEKECLNVQNKLPLNLKLIANQNQNICLEYCFNKISGGVMGEVCESAKTSPLTSTGAKEQLQKLGDTNFYLNNFEFLSNGVFVSKQTLNNLRRQVIQKIEDNFTINKNIEINYEYLSKVQKLIKNTAQNNKKQQKNIDFGEKYTSSANFLVIKPQNYNAFDYSKITHTNAYLYVPSFMQDGDIKLITNILNNNPNLGVYAQNIGALNFNKKTILGAKLNIKNIYAVLELANKNVQAIVTSPEISEENYNILNESFTLPIFKSNLDNFDLMTLVHCPIKTLFNSNCNSCKYCDDIIYVMENGAKLKLNRYQLKNCYFTLNKV